MNTKKVLFVCRENACRSQMAEGFFNTFATNAWAKSAGIYPAKEADPMAIKVMKEYGVDISQEKPKILKSKMNDEFDYIITMGCIDSCPVTPKEKTIEWDIEDPKGKPIEKYRDIRDMIKHHVEELIDEVIN